VLSPAWNSSISDSVPRHDLPPGHHSDQHRLQRGARLGPALAGAVFLYLGGAWNFALAVLSTLVMMQAIRRFPPKPHPPTRLPAERLWGGMVSALRFAWHSHTVLSQLLRAGAYSAAGSALWALLPVIGQRQLGLGAAASG
jgi:hypothetical protein